MGRLETVLGTIGTSAAEPGFHARFWSKAVFESGSGCLLWSAAHDPKGYGRFGRGYGNMLKAHRVAYKLATGRTPGQLFVTHSCDNPRCVNPDHLSLGTPASNMRERELRGRANRARGESHGRSRYSDDQVSAVRVAHREHGNAARAARSVGVPAAWARSVCRGAAR